MVDLIWHVYPPQDTRTDWFRNCVRHSYMHHRNQLTDIKRSAEKSHKVTEGATQIVHHHEIHIPCNGECEVLGVDPTEITQPEVIEVAASQVVMFNDPVAKVQLQDPNAKIPTRAYPGDAGFDLYYCGERSLAIQPHAVAHVPSRVAIQWPDGMWSLIIGRSSAFARGLLINPTVIDAGWRGELFAYVRNATDEPVAIEPGERIAQIVPITLLADQIQMMPVPELDPSERGEQGFGSSGR